VAGSRFGRISRAQRTLLATGSHKAAKKDDNEDLHSLTSAKGSV